MIPLQVEGGFQTDSSGKGIDTRLITSGNYSAVWASCQCNGTGQWVMGATGYPQYFQSGANVVMGPVLLRPGEQIQVEVVGANSGAEAAINYWGWQGGNSADPSDLAPFFSSPLTAGSISGAEALTLSGPVSISGNVPVQNASGTSLSVIQNDQFMAEGQLIGANQTFEHTFTIPDGTGAFVLTVECITVGDSIASMSLLDVSSAYASEEFLNLTRFTSTSESNTLTQHAVSDACDRVQLTITTGPTNTGIVNYQFAIMPPGAVVSAEIANTPGNPVVAEVVNAPGNPVQVQNVGPPPSDTILLAGELPTSGGTFTILAAPASPNFIRLYAFQHALIGGTAGSSNITTTDGRYLSILNSTTTPPMNNNVKDFGGSPLPVGQGISGSVVAGGGCFYSFFYRITSE